jgi:hypothetical protein
VSHPTTEALQSSLLGVEEDLKGVVADELAAVADELDALREALGSAVLVALVVSANGLSDTPIGDTQFRIFTIDHYWNATGPAITVNDPNPNNSTDHYIPWSGGRAFDPTKEIFGLVFLGYADGDTLGVSKWYEITSVRMTLRANARGVY